MKQFTLLFFLLIVACSTSKNNSTKLNSASTEQVFVANQTNGLPGKCYQKMMLESERVWTEVLCQNKITKGIIRQIQADLTRLGYEIQDTETTKANFGITTKAAVKEFQIKNKMAFGGLDWATINRLRTQ